VVDIPAVFSRYGSAHITVEVAGPPDYDCGRVIVRGDVDGFRMLAELLTGMANAVSESSHPASQHGWQLALAPHDVPQLAMDNAMFVLDCEPSDGVSALRG
jgi:hypothetical protein